jgi:hypothetical protein
MDASVWISLAGLGVTIVGGAAGYGALRQQVSSLKEALSKVEGRVTACEAGHANTAQEMNALRVDVAILTERSGATITSLDRIERHLADRPQAPARRRAVTK